MIAKGDMMGLLLDVCPAFRPTWEAWLAEWAESADDLPLYLRRPSSPGTLSGCWSGPRRRVSRQSSGQWSGCKWRASTTSGRRPSWSCLKTCRTSTCTSTAQTRSSSARSSDQSRPPRGTASTRSAQCRGAQGGGAFEAGSRGRPRRSTRTRSKTRSAAARPAPIPQGVAAEPSAGCHADGSASACESHGAGSWFWDEWAAPIHVVRGRPADPKRSCQPAL